MPEQVDEVFDFWKQMLATDRSRLDDKRKKAITNMLRAGYSVEDLQMACLGCKSSEWHMGSNDRNRRYCSIELICRDADHVDQFIEIAEKEAARIMRQVSERAQPATAKPTMPQEIRAKLDALLGRFRATKPA